jgi:hypothetical protein
METNESVWQVPKPRKSVIKWLLDSDPAIRWQVMRDITDESDEIVADERSRVAKKQHQNGRWPLQNPHPDRVHFDMEDGVGTASRWNTLRSFRVLDWY